MPLSKSPLRNTNLRNLESLVRNRATEHAEYYWKTPDDITLYSQSWLPIKTPIAVINLVHGLGEHSNRYAGWAKKFTDEGYIVRGFDLRGHGRSGGKRGYSHSYSCLLSDIEEFIRMGSEEFKPLPAFIYGHSLGGNLVLNLAIRNLMNVHGLIITSPWLELVTKPAYIKQMMAKFLGRFFPALSVMNGILPEDLSRDLRSIYEYMNDPLVHNRISIRLAMEIIEAGTRAASSIYKINVPMLVMHGDSDRITSCKATRKFVRNAGKRTSYIEWADGYHELHMDRDREKVFIATLQWLNRCT